MRRNLALTTGKVLGAWLVLAAALCPATVAAEGHGPIFGLATPTLGKGQWSSDTAVMSMANADERANMFREILGYGLTPDLQLSVSFPLGTADGLASPPNTRGGAMMAGFGEWEASMLWRFQRHAPAVGKRRESTLIASVLAPGANDRRGGVKVTPGLHLGGVTGYASRTLYWWLGAGAQFRQDDGGEQLGDLYYLTAVLGWRPPVFRGDYPKPDWRFFIEAVAEQSERDRMNGAVMQDSGGQRVLAGPSMLGLFGAWGIEGGVLFPLHESLNGSQPAEDYRAKLVLTYWF